MPEPALRRRVLDAVAAVGIATAVLAPAAAAQSDEVPDSAPDRTDPWAASTFDPPFDEPGHVVRVQPFDVAGTLRYEKTGPADHIVEAEVRIVPDRGQDLRDGCELPTPAVVAGPGPQPELTAELAFRAAFDVACNGRYVLEVEATLDDPDAPTHTLSQPFDVGALPPAVTDLVVDVDDAERRVVATFTPVPDDQLDPDAIGYVLERSAAGDGGYVDAAAIDVDDEPRLVDDLADAPAGSYTYRVRSVRAGPGEPERSSVLDTETATVTVGEPVDAPPSTEAGVATRGPRRGSVSVPRRGTTLPRRVTVTTLDTGFEGTIDYGELPEGTTPPPDVEIPGDEPLAGQSIITEEGEGTDLAGPVAGALVLLGWAGHIAYLNRLAKQLSPGP
ncbi:MAG: hypothetical protein ACLGIC_06340 [Acidimicrobiia bacterium]